MVYFIKHFVLFDFQGPNGIPGRFGETGDRVTSGLPGLPGQKGEPDPLYEFSHSKKYFDLSFYRVPTVFPGDLAKREIVVRLASRVCRVRKESPVSLEMMDFQDNLVPQVGSLFNVCCDVSKSRPYKITVCVSLYIVNYKISKT